MPAGRVELPVYVSQNLSLPKSPTLAACTATAAGTSSLLCPPAGMGPCQWLRPAAVPDAAGCLPLFVRSGRCREARYALRGAAGRRLGVLLPSPAAAAGSRARPAADSGRPPSPVGHCHRLFRRHLLDNLAERVDRLRRAV